MSDDKVRELLKGIASQNNVIQKQNDRILQQNEQIIELFGELSAAILEATEMPEGVPEMDQATLLAEAIRDLAGGDKEPETEFPAWGAPLKKDK